MGRKGRSNEEIVHALHQVEGGEKVAEVCRRLEVSEQTFYRWRKRFAGLGVQELRELRSLRDENRKLKQVSRKKSTIVNQPRFNNQRSSNHGQLNTRTPASSRDEAGVEK